MSIYFVAYGSTADGFAQATSTSYSTARNSTIATSFLTSGNIAAGQIFSSPNYDINQGFFRFDLSTLPAGSGTGTINLTVGTQISTATGTIEFAEASSLSNKKAGASLPTTVLASVACPTGVTGTKFSASIANVSTMTRSATFNLHAFSPNERNNIAPTDTNNNIYAKSADTAGTTDDPYLSVLLGTPWSIVGVSTSVVQAASATITLTEPAGVAPGDLLVACFAVRTTVSGTNPMSVTGWTSVNFQGNNNVSATAGSAIASGSMWYVVRGASAPTLAFSMQGSWSVGIGQLIAYRGHTLTAAPLDVSTAGTTATGISAVSVTGLTTTQDDDLIVAMAAGGQEATWSGFSNVTTPIGASGATDTTTAPSTTAWIERGETITTSGADTSLGIFDAVRTGTGATGNLTVTASIASGHVVVAGAFKIRRADEVTLVQSNKGLSTSATTSGIGFSVAPTAGNLIVLAISADDYNVSPDTGWTQSSEMEQQTFHGGYLWWRISDGSNSFQYTISSAVNSAWVLTEFSGVAASPYDASEGQFAATTGTTYTTPNITPTAGNRLLVAAMGIGHNTNNLSADMTSWLNSFMHIRTSGTANVAGQDVAIGVAWRPVAANGSTAYSTGATFLNAEARSGLIISFKEGAGGPTAYTLPAVAGAYAVTGTAASPGKKP